MKSYQNPYSSKYVDALHNELRRIHPNTKEYYINAGIGVQLPLFLKLCNYFMLHNDIALFTTSRTIKRSSNVPLELNHLIRLTNAEDSDSMTTPLIYSAARRDDWGIKETYGIHIINVIGQIQDTFEQFIPAWASSCDAQEILGVSLALKLTPKHRIRVYKRNEHIVVFTTKGLTDAYDNDFILHRKLYACLPLMLGWMNTETNTCKYPEVYSLLRGLEYNDATTFWDLFEMLCSTNPTLKDITYKGIFDAFKHINENRIKGFMTKSDEWRVRLQQLERDYSEILNEKDKCDKMILTLTTNEVLEPDTIKLLTDKRICYALDISQLTDANNARMSFRCSAPVLNFDKSAAKAYYNRRIEGIYSNTFCKLFKLLFFNEKVVLNFDEEIVINFTQLSVQAKNGLLLHGNNYDNCLPNPHHAYHNCWGNYMPQIKKLIADFNLEDLFYQIKAAVSSINFTDFIVIGAFMTDLQHIIDGDYNAPCFLWRDEDCTTLHTLNETLEHFKEDEE